MKKKIFIMALFSSLLGLFSCDSSNPKSDTEKFEEVLNDPRINSKEVGKSQGIKYFQVIKNGKTGFRDLDGKITIEPQFDNAEMFSEGLSTVKLGNKYGLINEQGKYVLPLTAFEYLGSVRNGLASFRKNEKYGFVNIKGQEIIKPQYDWVDEFSEGLCVVRNDNGNPGSGKHGYIDTTGKVIIKMLFQYACKFENGQAKVEINNVWEMIDKSGKTIAPATH